MVYNQLYHECFLGIILKVRENISLDVNIIHLLVDELCCQNMLQLSCVRCGMPAMMVLVAKGISVLGDPCEARIRGTC
jgi:hypothetical protein